MKSVRHLMKILVTGAAGFIGFHLCRRLAGRGDEIIGIDSINDYYDPALKYARLSELGISKAAADSCQVAQSASLKAFSFLRLSIEDAEGTSSLFRDHEFDCVLHLAAQAGVRYSIENPRAYISANIDGFLNILEGCRPVRRAPSCLCVRAPLSMGFRRRIPFSEHVPADHPGAASMPPQSAPTK